VSTASARLSEEGLATLDEQGTACCYAVQDKVWVQDPDGAPWELYTVLADIPEDSGLRGDGSCCVTDPATVETNSDTRASCC